MSALNVASYDFSNGGEHTPKQNNSLISSRITSVPNDFQIINANGPYSPNQSSRGVSRGRYMSRTITPSGSRALSPGTPGSGIAPASIVSKEDKFEAMMGRKDLNHSVTEFGEILFREEFCGACGVIHPNPDLMDMYNTCKACQCTLREPVALRRRYEGIL